MIRTVFLVMNMQHFVPDMAQYSMQLRVVLLHLAMTGCCFPMIEPIEEVGCRSHFRFLIGEDTAVQQGGWGAETNALVQALVAHADDQFSLNPWANRQRKRARLCQERVRQMIHTALNDALQRYQPVTHNQFVSLMHSLAAKYKEEYPKRTHWDVDTLAQHLDTVATMLLAADVSSMVVTVASPHTPSLFPILPQPP